MALSVDFHVVPDPTGHGAALLLKGDWVFVAVSDGEHTGVGEASHSGDDQACIAAMRDLFEAHVRDIAPTVEAVRRLEQGPFAEAGDRVEATAISGLNQALYELAARQRGVPVWGLFTEKPVRTTVPLYLTINRVLSSRTDDDYLQTVGAALKAGFREIKCAPFEAVTPDGDQREQCRRGLGILRLLRTEFPELDLRIDFHKRFTHENFLSLLPEIEALSPHWIEEPCPEVARYAEIRDRTDIPVAAGELFFGAEGFVGLASRKCADVIRPDVKHVGGFGPLLRVCAEAGAFDVEVSPHNPSGPVSTVASAHAAAVSPVATSVETSVIDVSGLPHGELVDGAAIRIPDGPGWGIQTDAFLRGP
jgi:galactonate dehydratase